MSFCDEHGTSDGCPDCITLGLEEENARLKKLINRVISHTSSKMQNYMIQAAYDGINQQLTDGLKDIMKAGEG